MSLQPFGQSPHAVVFPHSAAAAGRLFELAAPVQQLAPRWTRCPPAMASVPTMRLVWNSPATHLAPATLDEALQKAVAGAGVALAGC
jgi:hypothetical protein